MEHNLIGIRIERDVVKALCTCGFQTDPAASETEARAAFDEHAAKEE